MDDVPIVFAAAWAAFYVYWLISAWRHRSPYKRRSSPLSLLSLGIVWIIVCMILLDTFAPGLITDRIVPDLPVYIVSGFLITLAGLAFAVWARVHLGKNWSGSPAIRQEHTITRTGPYRHVRHPIYSGLILAMTGTAIGIGYFWAFFCILILIVVFVIKFRREEELLTGEFGEEYRRYQREVKALIPYLL